MPADPTASPDPASDPDARRRTDSEGALTFESRFRARSYELDALDHVNHAVYLNWLEQARFDALEAGGCPADRMAAEGWAVVVVRVEIDYHAEVRLGDRIRVTTRVAGSRKTSMTLAQTVTRLRTDPADDGEDAVTAAEARVVAVWLREGRPRRIPPAIREALGAP